MIFCRLGGLSPVKHKMGKDGIRTCHFPPPTRYGIYAFIWPYIEIFFVTLRKDWEKEIKRDGFRKFKYDGPIWCHWSNTMKMLSDKSWVLVDTGDLKQAFKKIRQFDRTLIIEESHHFCGDPYKRGRTNTFTVARDHLEVYIDGRNLGRVRSI